MDVIAGDLYVRGSLKIGNKLQVDEIPSACVEDSSVKADAAVAATKIEQQHAISYYQPDGTDVVAAIMPVHIVYGATGTLIGFEAACVDAPTGGTATFTVDLQKANEGAPAPATVLDGGTPITFVNDDTDDCEVLAGTLDSSKLILSVGDILFVVVVVSAGTGAQGQGLIVTLTLRETPE